MTSDRATVRVAALRLPAKARAALAAELIRSLEDEEEPADEVRAAWSDEIRRRLDEVDSGAVKPVAWREARSRIRAAARGRGKTR